ncbi:MAG: hypothetical protein JW797_08430 [Bradymonadales bacterium]|nr:hypothetical protein [Bradymonadales bacterium]
MAEQLVSRELEGVTPVGSRICQIDGLNGKLTYRGYSIEELVRYSSFEEVTYLLLYEKLPNRREIQDFTDKMVAARSLSPPILEMIRSFPLGSHPMELLQSVISYLSGHVRHRIQHSPTCNCRVTLHQVVQIASVIAAYNRYREGKAYVAPSGDLSHGANFLYMMRGTQPEPDEGEIMDKCLVLYAEHGLHASTVTARVVASTFSTCYCSISSAMGALYGPLHGGVTEHDIELLLEVGAKENAEKWVDSQITQKRSIRGMGHRLYQTEDPRASLMESFLLQLSDRKNDHRYYDILKEVERIARLRAEEAGHPIFPSVDFYSGAVFTLLSIPPILFTPVVAAARAAGWLAHILEQRVNNRPIQPTCEYLGPPPRPYVPLDSR